MNYFLNYIYNFDINITIIIVLYKHTKNNNHHYNIQNQILRGIFYIEKPISDIMYKNISKIICKLRSSNPHDVTLKN